MQTYDDSAEDVFWVHPLHEEITNAVIHGIGLVLCVWGAVAVAATGRIVGVGEMVPFGVYMASLIVVYTASMLSHAVQWPTAKHVLRTWDQGTIYLLIAGTYTPFICEYLSPPYQWLVLAIVWTSAVTGFYTKVFARHRVNAFSAQSYLVLGWVPALALFSFVPTGCLIWMGIGGVSYSLGTIFLKMHRRYAFFHAVWHLFVIAGSASHFYAIIKFVVMRELNG